MLTLPSFTVGLFFRFFNLKTDFENGHTTAASLREGRYVKSQRFLTARTWFEKFLEAMPDRMPNENKMNLPSCMTQEGVYKTYVEDLTANSRDEKPLGYSQFRNMWKKHYRHVIIPKVSVLANCWFLLLLYECLITCNKLFLYCICAFLLLQVNRFTKCGVCTIIKEHIHKLKGKAQKLTWMKRKDMHLKQQAQVKGYQRSQPVNSLIHL